VLSAREEAYLGSSLSTRSFARLGSSLSVNGSTGVGGSLTAYDEAGVQKSVSVFGALYVGIQNGSECCGCWGVHGRLLRRESLPEF
jgi:hypothetical protein